MSDVRASDEPTPLDTGHDRDEPHDANVGARLNWLRAGVLGANDGIVSTAGVVVGVAGATSDKAAIILAGLAALSAGAMSMAAGEYVSVSTQRDSERALLTLERKELHEDPDGELEELTRLYEEKGMRRELAAEVAQELTAHDALTAHAEAELGIDPTELPVTPPAIPYAYAVSPAVATPIAGPDVPLSPTGLPVREKQAGAASTGDGSRWNAKKTAVTAGLALVLTSAGAIGAAAAMPAGTTGGDTGFRGPGGGRSFQFPGGQQGLPNQQGTSPQQLPNLQNGVPGGGLNGIDPNQLGQLDPQDLLQQLGLGVDPFSDDQGQDPFSDDPGQDDTGSSTSDMGGAPIDGCGGAIDRCTHG